MNTLRKLMACQTVFAVLAVTAFAESPSFLDLAGSDVAGSSAMNGEGSTPGWSDGSKKAVAGKSYRVQGKSLRTPDGGSSAWTGGYTFAGDCLQFAEGAELVTKHYNGCKLTIPFLQVTGSALVYHGNPTILYPQTAVAELSGDNWRVEAGGTLHLRCRQSNSALELDASRYATPTYLVTASISGTGTIKTGTDEGKFSSKPGVVEFAGDNGAFTGKLLTIANVSVVTKFDTAASWFGNPAEPVADGVTLAAKMKLVFGATLSTGANRGFVCEGATSEISVEAGQTVTVDGPFAAQNGFTKTGAGTLVISGETGVDPARIKITGGVVRIGGTDYFAPVPAVQERLCDELIRELGGTQAILAAAAAVPALPASGRWGDIDYASHANSNWSPRYHFERCQALAAAIYLGAPQADDYAATIVKAMEAWYADVPTSVNWWQQIINIPQMAGRIALLAEGKIANEEVFGSIVDNVATDYNNPSVQTGANLLRVSGIRFMHGVLVRDEEEMEFQAARIKNEVKIVPFGQEGIVDDWCFHQHGSQPQINNYGLEYLQGNVTWIRVFAGESYAYPQEKIDILMNMATNCFAWSVWRGVMSPDTMGRQLYRSMAGDGAEMTTAIGLLVGEVPEPVGYRYFPRSAYAVNRSTNWMATVKMGTAQIISTESGNHENLKGKFVGDGAIYTMVTGLEYNDVYPLWDDWRMAPGVTQMRGVSVDWPNPPDVGGNFRRPTATVSNSDANKTTTFAYGPEEGLSYTKSWTFRENGYDVKVWNIAVTAQAPSARTDVATCVENANAAEDAGLVTQNADYSVYRNGEVYYIVWAAPEQISFVLEDRKGDVGDYTTYYPREVSGRLFQIVVSHGRNPSNAALSYAVRIGGWNEKDGKLQTVVYVDKNASPDNQPPYDSPENAVDSIERGAASVAFGGKVILAPNQTWGLDGTLSLAGSFSLVGPSDRSTVITGAGVSVNAGQTFENLTFENDVVTVNSDGVISNCVVRGGNGLTGSAARALVGNGGQIADTIVEDFVDNGVFCMAGTTHFVRCVVRDGKGSGAKSDPLHTYAPVSIAPGAKGVFAQCDFTNNVSSDPAGAGMLAGYGRDVNGAGCTCILDRCRIVGNKGRFGVVRLSSTGGPSDRSTLESRLYATNCLFAANESIACGTSAANRMFWCCGEFVNCTIADNKVGADFPLFIFGILTVTDRPDYCKFVNTVISGNVDPGGNEVATYEGKYGVISAQNCLFPEVKTDAAYQKNGNVAGPAIFRGAGKTPYALKENSPGYGTGDASIWTKEDVDLVGKRRLNSDKSVDMGCYRSHPICGSILFVR